MVHNRVRKIESAGKNSDIQPAVFECLRFVPSLHHLLEKTHQLRCIPALRNRRALECNLPRKHPVGTFQVMIT